MLGALRRLASQPPRSALLCRHASLTRGPQNAPGRSPWVCHNGAVYTVAYPMGLTPEDSVADQTRKALQSLDERLAQAGTDKSRIIEATVFLADMSTFNQMDSVWCDYIPGSCGPSRATVGADFGESGVLVEMKVTAAMPEE